MLQFENLNKLNQRFAGDFQKRLSEILSDGKFILGDNVADFERQFAKYCGTTFCVGTGNGTDALTIALKSFAFAADAEVIVPANTYIASIIAVINAGLKPVLVEPDIATYTIDPSRIADAVTKKTVAVMAVHLYGKCCDMTAIENICRQNRLMIIEDCAQSHGAAFMGRKAGTFGDAAAFSFYPTKNLGALGDAGCITTNDGERNGMAIALRNYGSKVKYYNEMIGFNSRMDELQAAFLSVKLPFLDEINAHKRSLAAMYSKNLKSDFILPVVNSNYFDVYHVYPVRHSKRDKLKDYLLKNDIGTEIHYPVPPHKQNAFAGIIERKDYPITEEIHSSILSLPISWIHTHSDIERVIETMNRF